MRAANSSPDPNLAPGGTRSSYKRQESRCKLDRQEARCKLVCVAGNTRATSKFAHRRKYERVSSCQNMALQDMDPYLLGNGPSDAPVVLHAYKLRSLQVTYEDGHRHPHFAVDGACLNDVGNPATLFFDNFGTIPIQSTTEVSSAKPCLSLPGRWILGTFGSHIVNMYDDFVLNTYPLYMGKTFFYNDEDELMVSHIDAPANMPHEWRWLSIYEALGSYTNWATLRANNTCIRFEEAVVTESTFWWQRKPISWGREYAKPMLQAFVHHYFQRQPQLPFEAGTCSTRLILYAKRTGKRKVVNSESFETTLRNYSRDYATRVISLENFEFQQQVQMVRSSSIFIFPHGAGGTHVLWLNPGAVAIELYPLSWANPMYRNLALMSGATFVAYQPQASHVAENRNVDFEVNIDEFSIVMQTAIVLVSNNLGDNWFNGDRPYNVSVQDLSVDWNCTQQVRNL